MDTLDTNLLNIDNPGKRRELAHALLDRDDSHQVPDGKTYKASVGGLVAAVCDYLHDRGIITDEDFYDKMVLSFTPIKKDDSKKLEFYLEPLLRILRGTPIADNISNDIFREMDQWTAIYFLAGIDYRSSPLTIEEEKFTSHDLADWPINLSVVWAIKGGVEGLMQYEHRLGNKKMPHRDQILEACKKIMQKYQEIMA